ncbi:DUF6507 family protein [Paenarthrobacter sp. NPDC090520]|uniref:DUF6507 family protein n=1 Tax=Paenarthrobacter sp. NPDC090520 TaxID=3364382 RepID=UPI0037F4DE4C
MTFDIDTGRTLAVVAASKQRMEQLPAVQAKLRHVCDDIRGALRSGPVYTAMESYEDSVLTVDVHGLARRTANVFGGTREAVAAYVACDEAMAATALANARSIVVLRPGDLPLDMSYWNPNSRDFPRDMSPWNPAK